MSSVNPHSRVLVKFAAKEEAGFYDTVRERVRLYFESSGLSPDADGRMYRKTAVMLTLYLAPYAFIIFGIGTASLWFFYAAWCIMGIGVVGIGTSVMHDSNHGSYSKNKALNNSMAFIIDFMGAYSVNWRIQHNILHHTYTNICGLDDDIYTGDLLRMSPNQPRKSFQRWQHIYAWPLYCLLNIYWVFLKDYRLAIQFNREGLLRKEKKTLSRAVCEITALRLVYFAYLVAVPMLFSGVAWYHCLAGFLIVQVIAGFWLSCIFQPAHVMETSDFSVPDDARRLENSWAVHQVLNTADFAPRNRPLSWFIGGLNRQIEHHLFPQVCHVHYAALAPIVRDTAVEFGLPYHVYPSFRGALQAHYQMLKMLGSEEGAKEVEADGIVVFSNSPD